ncbi:MAG: hypothetical protein KY463_16400, partial [Actinobacteria bacterium]|nr:hypothetical protein [Actinomycetota bacterium]
NRMVGFSAAADALRRRRGRAYDPEVADAFLADGESWLRELATGTAWDAVMAAEPSPPLCIGEAKLDDCLSAFADAVIVALSLVSVRTRSYQRSNGANGQAPVAPTW